MQAKTRVSSAGTEAGSSVGANDTWFVVTGDGLLEGEIKTSEGTTDAENVGEEEEGEEGNDVSMLMGPTVFAGGFWPAWVGV